METPRRQIGGILHFVNAVVLLGIAAMSLWSWPRLPNRIPIHFDFEGVPNRWTERGPEFAMLFIMPWFVCGVLYTVWASLGYFRRHPELGNLPKRYRGLPPEQVAPFFDALRGAVLAMATAMLLLFAAVLYGTLQVALGAQERLPVWATWPGLVLIGVVVIVGSIRVFAMSRRPPSLREGKDGATRSRR